MAIERRYKRVSTPSATIPPEEPEVQQSETQIQASAPEQVPEQVSQTIPEQAPVATVPTTTTKTDMQKSAEGFKQTPVVQNPVQTKATNLVSDAQNITPPVTPVQGENSLTKVDAPPVIDYSKSIQDIIKQNPNIPISTILQGSNDYRLKNGQPPLDVFQYAPVLFGNDMDKSAKENLDDAKKQARRERWERIGNVLSHAGNLFGTIMGAPSQNLESSDHLTARQQQIRDNTLKQRNLYNNLFLTQYNREQANKRAEEQAKAVNDYRKTMAGIAADKASDAHDLNGARVENAKADIENKKARTTTEGTKQKLYNSKTATEDENRGLKKGLISAQVKAAKARANASNASAAKSNRTGYGKSGTTSHATESGKSGAKGNDEFAELAEWQRRYPNEYNDFAKKNSIGTDKYGIPTQKSWSKVNAQQFNRQMRLEHGSGSKSLGIGLGHKSTGSGKSLGLNIHKN